MGAGGPICEITKRREARRQRREFLHGDVGREALHHLPDPLVLLHQRGAAVSHHPGCGVDLHQLQPGDRAMEPSLRAGQVAVVGGQPHDERLEQLAALEPPVGAVPQRRLRSLERDARRRHVVQAERRDPGAGVSADRDIRGTKLFGQRRSVAIEPEGRFGVATLALEAGQVVQRREAVGVAPQRGVVPERVLAGILGRGEIASPQFQHAEIHRRARGDVERVRLARERERGAKRLGARMVVARPRARHAEREKGTRLHRPVAPAVCMRHQPQQQLHGLQRSHRDQGDPEPVHRLAGECLVITALRERHRILRDGNRLRRLPHARQCLHQQGPDLHHVGARSIALGDDEQGAALGFRLRRALAEPHSRVQVALPHGKRTRRLASHHRIGEHRVTPARHVGPSSREFGDARQLVLRRHALIVRARVDERQLQKVGCFVERVERHRARRCAAAPGVRLRAVTTTRVVGRHFAHRLRAARRQQIGDAAVEEPLSSRAHRAQHGVHQQGMRELIDVVVLPGRRLQHGARQTPVHGIEHRVHGHAGGGGEQREWKSAPDRRRRHQNAQHVAGKAREATPHQVRHSRWQRERLGNGPGPGASRIGEDPLLGHRAQELHHQERIAFGVAQHEVEQVVPQLRPVQRTLQPFAHLAHVQALESQLARALVARQPLPALAHDAERCLLAPQRDRHADALRRELREHILQRVPACRVCPVHVFEHEGERAHFRRGAQKADQLLQQLMSLRRIQRRDRHRCRGSAQHRHQTLEQWPRSRRRESEFVEAQHELRPRPEGGAILTLERAPTHHRRAAQAHLGQELTHERGLADTRLAKHEPHLRRTVHALVERADKRTPLDGSPHETVEDELRRSFARRARHHDLVASLALGLEQRAIGRREQRLEALAMHGRRRHANRERDGDRLRAILAQRDGHRARDDAQLVSKDARGVRVEPRQQHDEFIARVASDVLARPELLPDGAGHELERIVAGKVPVRVVHRLELVHVRHQQRDRRAGTTALGEHCRRDVDEGASHQRSGQIVLLRHRHRTHRAEPAHRREVPRFGASRHRAAPHELLESRQEVRVELLPRLAAHDLHCLEVREGALVAAFRRQRVVHVGDAEYACHERDVLARERVGIALAVPPLVVAAHHRRDLPREIHVGEHLGPRCGMLPHERPLIVGELVGLVQHVRGDDELSDVVEQRADPEPEEHRLVQPHLGGERAREIRHPLAVAVGVYVLGLDRIAPLANDVQEVAFEPRHPATDVGQLMARAKRREAAVRAIERLERLAVAAKPLVQLGELAVGVALEGEVAHASTHRPRALQECFRRRQVSRLPRDDTVQLLRLAVGTRVAQICRQLHPAIAAAPSFDEIAALDLQRREVHLELDPHREPAQRIRDRERFGERFFGRVETAKLEVGNPQGVQGAADVIEQ